MGIGIEILVVIFIISLWCVGFYSATRTGFLLDFISAPARNANTRWRDFLLKHNFKKGNNLLTEKDAKVFDYEKARYENIVSFYRPISECLVCMSSFHSTLVIFVLHFYCPYTFVSVTYLFEKPLLFVGVIIMVAGLNTIIKSFLDKNGVLQ